MVDVYDEWNDDGNLPKIEKCPFCGGRGMLCDDGGQEPVIDSETGAYIDMEFWEGSTFWIECEGCGCLLGGEETPEQAIEKWNKRQAE